jgi:hypothetical protein
VTDVLKGHLDAIGATLALLEAQVIALGKHVLTAETMPASAAPVTDPICAAMDPHACGRQDEDARRSRATFTDPQAWVCGGCGRTRHEVLGAH